MKKTILLFAALLGLLSCQKIDRTEALDELPFAGTPVGKVMPMSQLQTLALEVADNPATRAVPKTIKEILPFSEILQASDEFQTLTRSGVPSSVDNIYVVNYEDDAGFSILSADTRMNPLIYVSDGGNLTGEVDNPGLQFFLSLIPDYAENAIAAFNDSMDYSQPMEISFLYSSAPGYYQPLLSKSEWGPYYPLNLVAPTCSSTGKPMPYGCVPTAIIQIMRYWEHPVTDSYFGNNTVNWSILPYYPGSKESPWAQTPEDNIKIIAKGVADASSVSFGCNGSGATDSEARRAFKRLGYKHGGSTGYTSAEVNADLKKNQPVYVSGTNTVGTKKGHAWVCDGYMLHTWTYHVYLVQYDEWGNVVWERFLRSYTELNDQHFHMNWGWGPGYNGYANPNVLRLDDNTYNPSKCDIIQNIRPNYLP